MNGYGFLTIALVIVLADFAVAAWAGWSWNCRPMRDERGPKREEG